jgi:hypothetical protein
MSLPAKAVATRLLVTVMALAGMALAARFIVDDRFNRDIQCLDEGPSVLYRAETLAKISMQCVSDARLGQATTYAYAALRRQPHNQLALAALGSVADLKNDPVRADFWFGRAKELGHRDYAVETYWISRRAAQKQWGEVAQHIDALFRAGWKSDDAEAQLRQLESTAEGRKAIIAIVHPSSPWIIAYLQNTSQLTDAELTGRRQLLLDINKLRLQDDGLLDLFVGAPAINSLYERGAYEDAYNLRRAFRPFTSGSIVNDPKFDHATKTASSPFDWTLKHTPGIDVLHTQRSSGLSSLRLNVIEPGRYVVLEQTLRLDPGGYHVEMSGSTQIDKNSHFVLEIRSVNGAKKYLSIRMGLPQTTMGSRASFSISSNERFYRISLLLDASESMATSGIDVHSFLIEDVL